MMLRKQDLQEALEGIGQGFFFASVFTVILYASIHAILA